MVEYILDVIKAKSGEPISITATITNDDETEDITTSAFMLLDEDNKEIYKAEGHLIEEDKWLYMIPAEVTSKLNGKYWYYVLGDENSLCFKNPFYLL